MASREEIEARIVQVKASLEENVALVAALDSDIQAMADQEAGSGHYGIASSYVSAKEQGERVTAAIVEATSGLDSMQASIAATAGLTSPPSSPRPHRRRNVRI